MPWPGLHPWESWKHSIHPWLASQPQSQNWDAYSTDFYCAKELTVYPKRSVTVRDAAAYGLIVNQGWGQVGAMEVETPSLIRYGELTKDELFVTAAAAQAGVVVSNRSDKENLVMLKHFGPGNPDAKHLIRSSASHADEPK